MNSLTRSRGEQPTTRERGQQQRDEIGAVILYVAEGFGEKFTEERGHVWRDALAGLDTDLLRRAAASMVKHNTVRPILPGHLLSWYRKHQEDRRLENSTDTSQHLQIGERLLPPEEALARIAAIRATLVRQMRA